MALVLNEEQEMLRDSAAGFLAEKASVAQLRSLRDSGSEQGFDSAIWSEVVEMGWSSIAIPEAYGGLGYGYTGLGVDLAQMGRNLSATPLEASELVGATAIQLLGTEDQNTEVLPASIRFLWRCRMDLPSTLWVPRCRRRARKRAFACPAKNAWCSTR